MMIIDITCDAYRLADDTVFNVNEMMRVSPFATPYAQKGL